MRRLAFIAMLAAGAALSACEAETRYDDEAPPPEPAPVGTAPPVAETPAPPPEPEPAPTGYQEPLPEPRSSEESVQPESETLFY